MAGGGYATTCGTAGTERLLLSYMDQMVVGILYYMDGLAVLQHTGRGHAGRYLEDITILHGPVYVVGSRITILHGKT